jgi:hypothetical protein
MRRQNFSNIYTCSKDWPCRARVTSDIALTGSHRARSTLAAAPVLFAHAVVTVAKTTYFKNDELQCPCHSGMCAHHERATHRLWRSQQQNILPRPHEATTKTCTRTCVYLECCAQTRQGPRGTCDPADPLALSAADCARTPCTQTLQPSTRQACPPSAKAMKIVSFPRMGATAPTPVLFCACYYHNSQTKTKGGYSAKQTKAECVHALKVLALQRTSHSSEIALVGLCRLHSTLVAAPVLFTNVVVTILYSSHNKPTITNPPSRTSPVACTRLSDDARFEMTAGVRTASAVESACAASCGVAMGVAGGDDISCMLDTRGVAYGVLSVSSSGTSSSLIST